MRFAVMDRCGKWAIIPTNIPDRIKMRASAIFCLVTSQWLKIKTDDAAAANMQDTDPLPVDPNKLAIAKPVLYQGELVGYKATPFYCGTLYSAVPEPQFWSIAAHAYDVSGEGSVCQYDTGTRDERTRVTFTTASGQTGYMMMPRSVVAQVLANKQPEVAKKLHEREVAALQEVLDEEREISASLIWQLSAATTELRMYKNTYPVTAFPSTPKVKARYELPDGRVGFLELPVEVAEGNLVKDGSDCPLCQCTGCQLCNGGTFEETKIDDCIVNPLSSRCCQRGTKSCRVDHDLPGPAEEPKQRS